ncbi:MAG: phytoene/squalene synthase family protein, partial [Pseudomonadota bacterium]
DPARALEGLYERLTRIYSGQPLNQPVDRAMADLVVRHNLPKAFLEWLFEGFLWDSTGRTYESLSDVRAYGVRVAGTVGVMMAWLMGARDQHILARACDLGIAMQLTNIARDVGEDANAGRLYLPRAWMREAGIQPEYFLDAPEMSEAMGSVIQRFLGEANALYKRSEAGIRALPRNCQTGIFAARLIYEAIGARLAARNYDAVNARAFVPGSIKVGLIFRAFTMRVQSSLTRPFRLPSEALYAPALQETEGLLAAADLNLQQIATQGETEGQIDWVFSLFERQLVRDETQR